MPTQNVLGYVTEVLVDTLPEGGHKVRLKLRLKNTLGKEQVLFVEGPVELGEFYSSELGLQVSP